MVDFNERHSVGVCSLNFFFDFATCASFFLFLERTGPIGQIVEMFLMTKVTRWTQTERGSLMSLDWDNYDGERLRCGGGDDDGEVDVDDVGGLLEVSKVILIA